MTECEELDLKNQEHRFFLTLIDFFKIQKTIVKDNRFFPKWPAAQSWQPLLLFPLLHFCSHSYVYREMLLNLLNETQKSQIGQVWQIV